MLRLTHENWCTRRIVRACEYRCSLRIRLVSALAGRAAIKCLRGQGAGYTVCTTVGLHGLCSGSSVGQYLSLHLSELLWRDHDRLDTTCCLYIGMLIRVYQDAQHQPMCEQAQQHRQGEPVAFRLGGHINDRGIMHGVITHERGISDCLLWFAVSLLGTVLAQIARQSQRWGR